TADQQPKQGSRHAELDEDWIVGGLLGEHSMRVNGSGADPRQDERRDDERGRASGDPDRQAGRFHSYSTHGLPPAVRTRRRRGESKASHSEYYIDFTAGQSVPTLTLF